MHASGSAVELKALQKEARVSGLSSLATRRGRADVAAQPAAEAAAGRGKRIAIPRSNERHHFICDVAIVFDVTSGALLRAGEVHHFERNLCCELGTYGCLLSTAPHTYLVNEYSGYVVRTKPADVDDGGVMAGVAALDALLVV